MISLISQPEKPKPLESKATLAMYVHILTCRLQLNSPSPGENVICKTKVKISFLGVFMV